MQNFQVFVVLVVWFEGDAVPVQLFLELFRSELVPFVRRRPILLVLLESFLIELFSLFLAFVRQDSLICFNAELVRIRPVILVLNEPVVFLVRIIVRFLLQILDHLLKVLLTACARQCHRVLLHSQLLKVPLYVIDRLLVLAELLLCLAIVVAEVARVQHIILKRVVVVSQRLQMMRPNEPLFIVLARHRIVDVL